MCICKTKVDWFFLLEMSISINVNCSMHFCLCMCNSNKLCSFEIWEKFTFMKSTFWKINIEKFYLLENCDMTQLEKGHFHQKRPIQLKMIFLPNLLFLVIPWLQTTQHLLFSSRWTWTCNWVKLDYNENIFTQVI